MSRRNEINVKSTKDDPGGTPGKQMRRRPRRETGPSSIRESSADDQEKPLRSSIASRDEDAPRHHRRSSVKRGVSFRKGTRSPPESHLNEARRQKRQRFRESKRVPPPSIPRVNPDEVLEWISLVDDWSITRFVIQLLSEGQVASNEIERLSADNKNWLEKTKRLKLKSCELKGLVTQMEVQNDVFKQAREAGQKANVTTREFQDPQDVTVASRQEKGSMSKTKDKARDTSSARPKEKGSSARAKLRSRKKDIGTATRAGSSKKEQSDADKAESECNALAKVSKHSADDLNVRVSGEAKSICATIDNAHSLLREMQPYWNRWEECRSEVLKDFRSEMDDLGKLLETNPGALTHPLMTNGTHRLQTFSTVLGDLRRVHNEVLASDIAYETVLRSIVAVCSELRRVHDQLRKIIQGGKNTSDALISRLGNDPSFVKEALNRAWISLSRLRIAFREAQASDHDRALMQTCIRSFEQVCREMQSRHELMPRTTVWVDSQIGSLFYVYSICCGLLQKAKFYHSPLATDLENAATDITVAVDGIQRIFRQAAHLTDKEEAESVEVPAGSYVDSAEDQDDDVDAHEELSPVTREIWKLFSPGNIDSLENL